MASAVLGTQGVTEVSELRSKVAEWRQRGERIALVPTMGALHAGHLSLVELGRRRAERLIVSIFVNPAQFGPNEDFETYPRPLARDLELLESVGADLVFTPTVATLYPAGSSTWVMVEGVSEGLEGESRPGHFRGVATVVLKLFNLTMPDLAIFGEKDAQQLAVIQRLVRDLVLPIEIVPGPIKREPDGLAMSSRNAYLSQEERSAARVLSRALGQARDLLAGGERSARALTEKVRAILAAEPRGTIDYVGLVDASTFRPIDTVERTAVLPIVFRLGKTRLLDNLRIEVENGVASGRL